MKPKELLFSHQYAEAVAAHLDHLQRHPSENYYPGLGQALLSLKRYSEALTAFKKANEIESQRLKNSQPFLNDIATALWLSGEKQSAMLQWHQACAGVLDGSVGYGDLAGGGTQGLLLWYGAVTLRDEPERDYALKYIRKLANRKAYALNWPRPIILMVLDEKSFVEILTMGIGNPDLSECLDKAKIDLLKRRQLCQALFYYGCQKRHLGNEAECIANMKLCAQLENPILESEWYLARGKSEPDDAAGLLL